ncbi:hypothetical protein BKI52_10510 [marine bacterium AO1-C]|nr:hypothetical protein BKI52_10510 [marine bacterium AO1-C]
MENNDPKTLTKFLLEHLQQRPGMFLKEPKLSALSTFLLGYSIGRSQINDDGFFGEQGFIQWLLHKKGNPKVSFWEVVLMEEAQNDEYQALELFFRYLEEYQKEQNT